ncbi:MAG TPA: 50S ribosomal protein L21 [bacterium]|nr:50S ribosomal protein L21 [bacterium]HPL95205.1 50S ribosomal protein L21 [bacterium]
MSQLAVIKTGGKQYVVKPGSVLKIEKIIGGKDTSLIFNDVLMLADEKDHSVTLGNPLVKNASVSASVMEQGRAKKIRVVHYKAKTREHKVYGHRQPFTKIKIEKIITS